MNDCNKNSTTVVVIVATLFKGCSSAVSHVDAGNRLFSIRVSALFFSFFSHFINFLLFVAGVLVAFVVRPVAVVVPDVVHVLLLPFLPLSLLLRHSSFAPYHRLEILGTRS